MKRDWRLRDAALFAAAMLLVWALAPVLTGQQEAWDAEPYYTLARMVSGFIAGLCRRCVKRDLGIDSETVEEVLTRVVH